MKRKMQQSAVCALGMMLLLCLPAMAAQSQQSQQRQSQVRDETTARVMAGISREVRHELLTLPYYGVFDWLEFEVRPDDTVVLRGQVTRPTTKSAAEGRVEDIEGVAKVINEIEVLPVSPNDDRLRVALYRAIYSGPLFRYAVGSLNTIHIIVENGRATLKGWVNSEADKQLAYTRARGVPGVFEVKNELRVEKSEG
ncbi:MAG TPA: BON domain-containing protein [Blastocatellia bacterium]|nr:BON domain-containing protein [Blastocatellia bacterium]